jgi:hypothetical protein
MSRHLRKVFQRGSVALEFLILFPFVIAILYASAVYGLVFFSQFRLQNVVDRAVSSALYVDRSADEEIQGKAVQRATDVMGELLAALPGPLGSLEDGASICEPAPVGEVEMIRCKVTYNYKENPIVPVMSFGLLGTFPPLPDTLEAEARAAF